MIRAYAAFEPGGEIKPFEYDPGPLGVDEVEIDVKHCGICHSDVSVLHSHWDIAEYPLVPGHEVSGRIAAVGEHVRHQIEPMTEHFPMERVNDAIARLESGEARYRVVLDR